MKIKKKEKRICRHNFCRYNKKAVKLNICLYIKLGYL